MVLMWDDPWWLTNLPPIDWGCGCGVRTLSQDDLEDLGKSGPDPAPKDALLQIIDKATGRMVMQPMGIGHGWDYKVRTIRAARPSCACLSGSGFAVAVLTSGATCPRCTSRASRCARCA